MSDIERIAALICEARMDIKGEVLSGNERDLRIAAYLWAHGVEIPVRCEECIFCRANGDELICLHPTHRNPTGCMAMDYCDRGEREKRINE